MTGYLTPARDATAEVEARRSRFVCTVARVPDEDAARVVVERTRRAHPDAGHHCSAFVLGPPPSPLERSSDDGEPSGTAGAPMLEVVRGRGLSDVVAVVSRWFGGTLLGTGGLARAYADAVRAGLDAAGTRPRRLLREHLLVLDHAEAAAVETALRSRGVVVLDTAHAAQVGLRVGVPSAQEALLVSVVAELTAGRVVPEPAGERWVDG